MATSREGGARPDPAEVRTEVIGPAVETPEGAENVLVDPALAEEAQFAEVQQGEKAREKERADRTAADERITEIRANIAGAGRDDNPPMSSEQRRNAARRQEVFGYLEKEKPLRAVFSEKLGQTVGQREKFIDKLRIARAQKEAGKDQDMDVETLNILNFLEKVHGKASGVDFSNRTVRDPHLSQEVMFIPREVAIGQEIFGRPLTAGEKFKAKFVKAKV